MKELPGYIDSIAISERDFPVKLNIPQTIVGRETEVQHILNVYSNVTRKCQEIMFISGAPGVGKSAVVNPVKRSVLQKKGYFISGKFEPFRVNVPYSAFIQSFQELVKQVLTEKKENIDQWKQKILQALQDNVGVITEVIPHVESIVGQDYPPVPIRDPAETKNRFHFAFQNFIQVFLDEARPMCIFLDDLQWADFASLSLIKALATNRDIHHLFIIGAGRKSEAGEYHSLQTLSDDIQNAGVYIRQLKLSSLNVEDVNKMIVNTLKCDTPTAFPLADAIFQKIGGNPFFVNEFIKQLADERYLKFNHVTGWTWDIAKINQMYIPGNVIELLSRKIEQLDRNVVELLKVCACIGNKFDFEFVSRIAQISAQDILLAAASAIQRGFIQKFGDVYSFSHNRIHETFYSLLSQAEKSDIHYKIGMETLGDCQSHRERYEKIFYIVNQLNSGCEKITQSQTRIALAELNLIAAHKAKSSTAYQSTLVYAKAGTSLLTKDCWQSHYELTFALFKIQMESEYLTLNFEQAKKLFKINIDKVAADLDKIEAYTLMITLYTTISDYDKAIALGFEAMSVFRRHKNYNLITRLKWPQNISGLKIFLEHVIVHLVFFRTKDLAEFPIIDAREVNLFAELCEKIGMVMIYLNPNYCILWNMRAVRLSLKYRVLTEKALISFGVLSSIYASMGYYDKSYKLSELIEKILQRANKNSQLSMLKVTKGFFVLPWKKHIRECLISLREGYQYGLQIGDFINARHGINQLIMYRIMAGDNLSDILKEAQTYQSFQQGAKNPFAERNFMENIWMCRCLIGQDERFGSFEVDLQNFDEIEREQYYIQGKNKLGLFYFALTQIRVHFFFGRYEQCLHSVEIVKQLITKQVSAKSFHIPEFYFYDALILTSTYSEASRFQKLMCKITLRRHKRKMKRWAKECPENFLHRYLLICAEANRISGNFKKASIYYRDAIRSACKNKFTQNEAIANECAAKFYIDYGYPDIARTYMTQAYNAYLRWGAKEICIRLKETCPDLIFIEHERMSLTNVDYMTLPMQHMLTDALDLATVTKASQAIASEIVLKNLLEKIMRIVIENTGAQKGILILEENGQLYINAKGVSETYETYVSEAIPMDWSHEVSQAIIRYVERKKDDILLNNAAEEGDFVNDPYIRKNKPKSILCVPILHKGKLSAILYLENSLTRGAFTPDRIKVVELLASQAAISIENAKLYDNVFKNERALRESEEKYRTILANIEDGYFEVDLGGAYTFINDTFCRIRGYDRDEIIGMNSRDHLEAESVNKVDHIYRKVQRTGIPVKGFEYEIIRKDGSHLEVEGSVSLIKDAEDKVIGFRSIVRDITQRKSSEKLRIERDVAEKASQTKSEFLANMSHEIRTPMNAILGFTDLLKDHIDSGPPLQYLDTIASSSKTLMTLINDILDLSKIEAGKLELNYQAITPAMILYDMQQIFQQKVVEKGIDFILEIDPKFPENIYLDEIRLRQILLNLVSNAIKFVENGYVKLSLTGKIRLDTLDVIIAVHDTGIGIPKEQIDSIFESFEQQKGQNSAKYGGTGLGLSISKKLTAIMNGVISVESEVGKGSVFTITFKDVKIADAADVDLAASESEIELLDFEPATVLIIDDIGENRALLKSYLGHTSLTVISAENAQEGIEKIKMHRPDVIITDIKMPQMDGYDVVRYVKNDPDLNKIPIIGVTASVLSNERDRVLESGCHNLLTKPISRQTMIHELMYHIPYTIQPRQDTVDEEIKPFDIEELPPAIKAKIPELMKALRGEMMDQWYTIQDGFAFDEIEDFAQNVIALGKDFHVEPLIVWGESLQQAAGDFDTLVVPRIIKCYPEVISFEAGGD